MTFYSLIVNTRYTIHACCYTWWRHDTDRFVPQRPQAFQALIAQERPHVLGVQEIRVAAPGATNRGSQKKDSAASSYVDVVKSLLPDYDTICEPAPLTCL